MPLNVGNFSHRLNRKKVVDTIMTLVEVKIGPHCSIFFGATCHKLLKKCLSGLAGSQVKLLPIGLLVVHDKSAVISTVCFKNS